MSDSDVRKDYVDAIIRVRVPEWQIGEKVFICFPDTMQTHSICERVGTVKFTRCIRCGKVLKNPEAKERGYGAVCWQKHIRDSQNNLF